MNGTNESTDITTKSLSYRTRISTHQITLVSPNNKRAKALRAARLRGSFTVEASFILPLFLFAAVVVIGMFPMLKLQTEVDSALQYAARMKAVAYQSDEITLGTLLSKSEKALFTSYMEEHGYEDSVLADGLNSITLTVSDASDDYVTLVASYDAQLPIAFWNWTSLPVQQCVKMKKWTGATDTEAEWGDDAEYYYVTATGSAYHSSTDCSYLRLSTHSVSVSELDALRNKSGGIYYPCSCYNGGDVAYITDYGTEYHSDLSCSSLKRTIYRISADELEGYHACPKCCN